MNKISIFFNIYLLLCVGCANIIPPNGGQKDLEPPKLIKVNTTISQNQNDKSILVFEFDENITVKEINNKFICSPFTKVEHIIKGKSLILILNGVIKDDVTYTLYIGSCIADVNEGNIVLPFQHMFGRDLLNDTLYIKGEVRNMKSSQNKENIVVAAYDKTWNTDAMSKSKPQYIAITDQNGKFSFPNLKNTEYYLYALEDMDNSYTYNLEDEEIAFLEHPVTPNKDSIALYLFGKTEKSDSLNAFKTDSIGSFGTLTINQLPENSIIEILKENQLIYREKARQKIYIDSLNAGTYTLRAVIDENKNNQWDTGDFEKRIQVEKIIYSKSSVIIRANWDIEINWKEEY